MPFLRRSFVAFALLLPLLFAAAAPGPAVAGESQGPLFVNLTSDEDGRAAMALGFARNAQKRGHPITIFLNVEGVRLAVKEEKPEPTQVALSEILANGGRVIVCPMCMKRAKIGAEQLIEGAELGAPDKTLPALFAEDTRVVSY